MSHRQLRLTPRQLEIAQLIRDGRTDKEIAHVLGLSGKTAGVHRYNLYRSVQVHSAAQLVDRLYQLGIFERGSDVPVPSGLLLCSDATCCFCHYLRLSRKMAA